jgi:signal peptidase I
LENIEPDGQLETQVPASEPQVPALEPQVPEEEKVNWKRLALDIVETVVLAVLLFIGINTVSARVRVDGFSMRPTLDDGEFVLVNRMTYFFSDFQRGDIIVFHFPMDPSQELIKRIIGLPGDVVSVANGNVMVNGQTINEPYIAAAPAYEGNWQVLEGELFVMGDNRNDSSDSHSWGLLPQKNVVGKAILIYWPPPLWKIINHTNVLAAGAAP